MAAALNRAGDEPLGGAGPRRRDLERDFSLIDEDVPLMI
jgi:hypothetical protein